MKLEHTYSIGINNKKILIFGFVPPPLGGVSVHIERVINVLRAQKNDVSLVQCEFRFRRLLLPFYLIYVAFLVLIKRPNIIYYHAIALPTALYEMRLLIRLKYLLKVQLILVEHDPRHLYKKTRTSLSTLRTIVLQIDHMVFIGTSAENSYRDCAVVPFSYSVESAFLPPPLSTFKGQPYPDELYNFMHAHRPIVAMNAFQCSLVDDKDLYGIDVALEALTLLKKDFHAIGLIIVMAQIGDKGHWSKMCEYIRLYGLEQHVYILTGQYVLWPLLKNIDLFLRPTLSDGYSVSIEEALYFNIPVIASDAVARPDSVMLFTSGDVASCATQMKIQLEEKGNYGKCNYLHAQSSR